MRKQWLEENAYLIAQAVNLGSPDVVSKSTLVCIPALNEAAIIASTLDRLTQFVPMSNILVIDDGSSDDTAARCRALGVRTISLVTNLGVGAAMRTGFRFAVLNGFAKVIQFDADGQHLPEYIETLEKTLDCYDLVIGSRFKDDASYRVGIIRSSAMKFLCFTVSGLIGVKLTDVTSGFRGGWYRSDQSFFGELPVRVLMRHGGLSHHCP